MLLFENVESQFIQKDIFYLKPVIFWFVQDWRLIYIYIYVYIYIFGMNWIIRNLVNWELVKWINWLLELLYIIELNEVNEWNTE